MHHETSTRAANAPDGRHSLGFTLVEMLVSISIIVIISSITFASFRGNEDKLDLQHSAQLVVQAVDQTKNFTLGSRLHREAGTADTLTPSGGGYGVYLKQGEGRILIFADCNDSDQYEDGPMTGDPDYIKDDCQEAFEAGGPVSTRYYPEEISEIVFPGKVVIAAVYAGSECVEQGPGGDLHTIFVPPNSLADFEPGGCIEPSIVLQNTAGDTAQVFINSVGVTRVQ